MTTLSARVDVSLYPLTEDYIPAIDSVIARFQSYDDIKVVTNRMSTQLTGDYDRLMQVLAQEMKSSLLAGKAVFVLKVLSVP
ncbi:MAG: YkoF family thiamine/hydroxymethylpyrimidine-binding protein [Pseudomonadota bacterium]